MDERQEHGVLPPVMSPRELIHSVPRPLAEHVRPDIATAAVRLYETRRNPSGLFHSAWHHAEYALNGELNDRGIANEYFNTSQNVISSIISHPEAHQDTLLGALTLSTYMPLFRKRAGDIAVTPEDCETVYDSLGAAMAYLKPLTLDEPPQWRMAEVSVLALSARTKQPWLLLYPTSPREEMSSFQPLNHDSYFIEDKGKIPLQQKLLPTKKTYDECITMLTLQPIVDKAMRVAGEQSWPNLSDKINHLISLIVAETHGAPITRDETKFLNFMSEAVAAHHYRLSGTGGVLKAA